MSRRPLSTSDPLPVASRPPPRSECTHTVECTTFWYTDAPASTGSAFGGSTLGWANPHARSKARRRRCIETSQARKGFAQFYATDPKDAKELFAAERRGFKV